MKEPVFVLDPADPHFEVLSQMLGRLGVRSRSKDDSPHAEDERLVAIVTADLERGWVESQAHTHAGISLPAWPGQMEVIAVSRGRVGRHHGMYQNLREAIRVARGVTTTRRSSLLRISRRRPGSLWGAARVGCSM